MKTRREILQKRVMEYKQAGKKEKGEILSEVQKITGYNRKYAITLLTNLGKKIPAIMEGKPVIIKPRIKKQKRRRKRIYDDGVMEALIKLWVIFDCICGKRLVYMIRAMLVSLIKKKEIVCSKEVKEKLLRISGAQVDRLLAPKRKEFKIRGMSHTRPGSMLKYQVPIRRGGEWKDVTTPGSLCMDLVGHEGGNSRGDFAMTLNITDIFTGWTEPVAVRNKAQKWIFEAILLVREKRLPFGIKSFHSDNGGEFINDILWRYCNEQNIGFTRSRPNRKNDNAHVEQKNNVVVRRFVGYHRYDTEEELRILNQLYERLRLYVNYFMPSAKLKSKERVGSRIVKRYEPYRTPFERLIASGALSKKTKADLERTKRDLNPAELIRQISRLQRELESCQNKKRNGLARKVS